jgi:hypothetical protein
MLRLVLTLLVLSLTVVLTPALQAGEKGTAKLADLAWLVGQWKSGPNEKSSFEEHWSTAEGGAMMGMFRLRQPNGSLLYEFLLIEEEASGVTLRLRHYRPHLQDMEKEPLQLKLIEATDKKLVFENPAGDQPKRISYALESAGLLVATVETTRNGQPMKFTLRMEKGK